MRSTDMDLERYDTDKVPNGYLERYDPVLERFVDSPVRLLELGVKRGGSLLLRRDSFPDGLVVGVDRTLPAGGSLRGEQGAADPTRGRESGRPRRQSTFESLIVTPPIVFVTTCRTRALTGPSGE